jgi:hypothetical protein
MAEKTKASTIQELQALSAGSSLQADPGGADCSGSFLAGWLGTTAFMSASLSGKKNLTPTWDSRPLQGQASGGKGVLVVGMGRETSGDNGVGIYLMRCLAQLNWPGNVRFANGS